MWIYLLYVSLMMDHVGLIKLTAADQGFVVKGTVNANEHSVIAYFLSCLYEPVWFSFFPYRLAELKFLCEVLDCWGLLHAQTHLHVHHSSCKQQTLIREPDPERINDLLVINMGDEIIIIIVTLDMFDLVHLKFMVCACIHGVKSCVRKWLEDFCHKKA